MAEKEKNTRSARKCLPKDDLNEGNVCGHCGEALTKLTELIAGLDKLLDLIVLIVLQGNHTMTQDKISLQALGYPSQILEHRAL